MASLPILQTADELGDKLCDYCPLEDEAKGTHGTPNSYSSCEGCRCDDAPARELEYSHNEKQSDPYHKLKSPLYRKLIETVRTFHSEAAEYLETHALLLPFCHNEAVFKIKTSLAQCLSAAFCWADAGTIPWRKIYKHLRDTPDLSTLRDLDSQFQSTKTKQEEENSMPSTTHETLENYSLLFNASGLLESEIIIKTDIETNRLYINAKPSLKGEIYEKVDLKLDYSSGIQIPSKFNVAAAEISLSNGLLLITFPTKTDRIKSFTFE